jgi:hypothetical protein
VQLIQIDHVHTERSPARFAGLAQVPGAAFVHPCSMRASKPSLRRNFNGRPVAGPPPQCIGDQLLVMSDVAFVVAVRVGGVQQPCARVQRRLNDGHGPVVIALGGGGKAHASETDHADNVAKYTPNALDRSKSASNVRR